jgi:CheY-like chemotaxis protein
MKAKSILIIEDEPEIRLILTMCLSHVGGYVTFEAADGLEGIEMARRVRPDLILLDALMPRMDGYTACRLMKQDPELRDIPVIFLTAKTDQKEVDRALWAGACGCLSKPFDPLALSAQIERIAQEATKSG